MAATPSARGTVTPCHSVDEPEAQEKVAANIWAQICLSETSTLGSQPKDTVQLDFDRHGNLEARDYIMLSQLGKLFLILSYGSDWKRRQRKRQTERWTETEPESQGMPVDECACLRGLAASRTSALKMPALCP